MIFLISIGEIPNHIEVIFGAFATLMAAWGGLKYKRSEQARKEMEFEFKLKQDELSLRQTQIKTRQDEAESSAAALSTLRDNVETLNKLWAEENKMRTKAEATAVRRSVALELMKEICPDCYDKLPKHFKIHNE